MIESNLLINLLINEIIKYTLFIFAKYIFIALQALYTQAVKEINKFLLQAYADLVPEAYLTYFLLMVISDGYIFLPSPITACFNIPSVIFN